MAPSIVNPKIADDGGSTTVELGWKDFWQSRESVKGEGLYTLLNYDGGYNSPFTGIDESVWSDYVDRISGRLGIKDGDSIFDVCCGTGALIYPFYQKGHRVGGIDFSNAMLEVAGKHMPQGGFHFDEASQMDAVPYDHVVSIASFIYFPDLAYTAEVVRRMVQKATRKVYIADLNNLQHIDRYRQKIQKNRSTWHVNGEADMNLYAHLQRLFFNPDWFLDLADKLNVNMEIVPQLLPHNLSPYRFSILIDLEK